MYLVTRAVVLEGVFTLAFGGGGEGVLVTELPKE